MKTYNQKRKLAFLVILLNTLLFSFLANAQEVSTVSTIQSAGADDIYDVEIDGDGFEYVLGLFTKTIDFDLGEGVTELSVDGAASNPTNGQALFLAKYNNGELIWAKKFADGGHNSGLSDFATGKMALDADGNIYIGGSFLYEADFDPGAGVTVLDPDINYHYRSIFFMKLDSDGNFQWAQKMSGSVQGRWSEVKDIAVDESSNIYLCGNFVRRLDFDPGAGSEVRETGTTGSGAFLGKYDTDGAFIWAKFLDRKTATAVIENDVFDGVFVGGAYSSGGAYVLNMTPEGNIARVFDYTGNSEADAEIYALTRDRYSNVYVAGSFEGTVSATASTTMTSNAFKDAFVSKIASQGFVDWSKSFGGSSSDIAFDVVVHPLGNIYVSGYFINTVDFDPGDEVHEETQDYLGRYILGLSSEGRFVSVKTFRSGNASLIGQNTYPGQLFGMKRSGFFNLWGGYSSSLEISIDGEITDIGSSGHRDMFVLKGSASPIVMTVDENAAIGTAVGNVKSNNDSNYPFPSIASGNTGGAFEIDYVNFSETITVSNPEALDFETTPSFRLEVVTVGDFGEDLGIDQYQTYIINLNDLPEGPSIENQSFTIISTIETNDEIGTIEASEPDDLPLTFSVISGNEDGIFSINESTGVITLVDRTALEFETATTFDLTVSVSNGTESADATISIIENLSPIYNWETTTYAYDENQGWGFQVPITDPDGDLNSVSFQSGNEAGLLTLESTASAGNPAFYEIIELSGFGLDYETQQKIFKVTVEGTDEAGNISVSDTITININNVNDNAPIFADSTLSIYEGLPNETSVITVEASDLDNDELTYSITAGNTDDAFILNANTGELSVGNTSALVFTTNPTFTLELSVTDGDSTDAATLTINLIETSGPVIEDQEFNIISTIETGDEVGTVEAFDAQDDEITFAITDGNTDNAFSINDATGVITLGDRSLLDFSVGNSYELTITASDAEETNSATVTIIVNNAPVFDWTATTFDFNENEPWFLTIPVTDAESDTLTFSITSGDETNLLSFSNTANTDATPVYEIESPADGLDFEADPTSFELIIEVSDDAGNTATSESITIQINNVNDNAPEVNDETVAINQNLPNGILVITVEGTDADGDGISYSIEDGNTDDAFSIDASTGEIIVANSDALVFDTNPTFELLIDVSDGSFTTTATIIINLNETAVNTAPIIEDQTFVLAENSENGTAIGTIEVLDLEGDALTFAIISGNTDNAFLLSSSTAELLVTNSEILDFETTPVFSLLVSVSDGALTETATITIDLTDEDETPVLSLTESTSISIYPNPASAYFQLSAEGSNIKSIRLLDEAGKTVRSYSVEMNNQYSLSEIRNGVYFLLVESEESISSKKIIVSR